VGVGRCLYRDICFPGSSNGFDDAATATAKPTRQRLQLPSIQKMLGLVHGPICAETLKGKYLLPYQKWYAVKGAITQCVTDTCRRNWQAINAPCPPWCAWATMFRRFSVGSSPSQTEFSSRDGCPHLNLLSFLMNDAVDRFMHPNFGCDPLARKSVTGKLWETHADWWQKGFTDGADPEYEEQILPLAVDLLKGFDRILDVGCGEGQITRRLNMANSQILGIDATWAQISEAAARSSEESYVRASAEAMPFKNHVFDAAIACLVFEHIVEMEDAIREVARVLRPLGALCSC